MKNPILVIVFCYLCTTGCTPKEENKEPEKTQLEIRQFQTRVFDTSDVRLAMKSVLDVLQDDGYIVKNVALDLGFLTAIKDVDIATSRERLFAQVTGGKDARWLKHQIIEATVNVSEFGQKIRVRANFQSKVLDNMGTVVAIKQIISESFYQEFFTAVSKGIFIQEQDI